MTADSRQRFLALVEQGSLPAEALGLVGLLQRVPEEDVWLAGLRSPRTRRAYRLDVADFVATLGIRSSEELYAAGTAAVLAWRTALEGDRKTGKLKPASIRRKLSALSSLFKHLTTRQLVKHNPVREVPRPRVNRDHGTTRALSRQQARAVLDAPDEGTVEGLRDRAILAVGFQVGLRRSELAHLRVSDLMQDRGYSCLRYTKKGGEENTVAINPQVTKRIRDYLARAGHGSDADAPMFLPTRGNQHTENQNPSRHLDADGVTRILQKYLRKALGTLDGEASQANPSDFSAHSMRATYITEALERGAAIEDVQRDVGHKSPSTTKLYDRRGHSHEKSTSFLVNY